MVRRKGIVMIKARPSVTLAVFVLAVFLYPNLSHAGSERPAVEEGLTLGVAARESSGLIYVAEKKGLFKKQGLNVTLKEYPTGLSGVNDLMAGKVDVATAAEFVFVIKSFEKSTLRIFSTVARGNDCQCIARRDAGIEKPSDLIGKRIGVVPGMQAEFFFNSFLSQNRIAPDKIKIRKITPPEIMKAIGDRSIDGVVTGLNTQDIKDLLGKNAISWSAQGFQDYYFLLISGEKFIQSRRSAVDRLLKALLEADEFVKKDRPEAQEIIKSSLKLNAAEGRALWDQNKYEVRLDQDLLVLMEAEARWAVRKGLVKGEKFPNYFKSVYLEGLKNIKPESISIIH
jgi:ABC-type nitrate/sulfonate/bicarbonate transport system substrate-binding protein